MKTYVSWGVTFSMLTIACTYLVIKIIIVLAYKGIISAGVCNFLSLLAMLTTTYKHTTYIEPFRF
jgi:hypothetical protein